MANRPVFYVNPNLQKDVLFKNIEFEWFSGFSSDQKKKSLQSLHRAANRSGIKNILEVSTKSNLSLGKSLSAFNLMYIDETNEIPVECVYQSSKCFQNAGPFEDIKFLSPKEAKQDPRLKTSGELKSFKFKNDNWELFPKTIFYDWIYMTALFKENNLHTEIEKYDAFTDIEFNPRTQTNCQARSVALFIQFKRLGILQEVLSCKKEFCKAYPKTSKLDENLPLFPFIN